LAVTEFAAFGWPLPTWFDTLAVALVLTSATIGLAASTQAALRVAVGSRALRALVRTSKRAMPPDVATEAAALGCAASLEVVAGAEPFAITYGLLRPRILVSAGLATALAPAEIRAVLAHEREHLRHRDPLRLLATRLLAAWCCYLPAAHWFADWAALRRELAADRAAAGCTGRGVLAAALLKLASTPPYPTVGAASPGGSEPWSLEARVTQLENGRPPRQQVAINRLLASGGALVLLGAASLCCAALSQVLPGGVL